LFLILAFSFPLHAQEGTWTLSGSTGVVVLTLNDVEGDNRKDVELWNLYEKIPIGDFQPLDYALAFSASGSYRFDRDMAVTFAVSNFRKEVVASYHGDQASLDLRRDVGSTDFKLGLAYYLPQAIYRVESYVLVEVGVMNSRATATAFGTKTEKAADSTLIITTYDSEGVYEKSKMFVTAGVGATSMMFSNVFMKLEAIYKFARIGTIDGQLRRFGVTAPHTTSIDFDYSSFFITFGFGMEF
jgi:hypothetical protein